MPPSLMAPPPEQAEAFEDAVDILKVARYRSAATHVVYAIGEGPPGGGPTDELWISPKASC